MPLAILTILKTIWDAFMGFVSWCVLNWRVVLIVAAVIVVVVAGFGIERQCGSRRKLVIDSQTVNKINAADEKTRKAELQTVIQQNADVVTTVDERNTIAAENEADRNAAAWAKINQADAKIAEAKQQGHDVTGPELECMLTGNCQ